MSDLGYYFSDGSQLFGRRRKPVYQGSSAPCLSLHAEFKRSDTPHA
ncbi:hypothetical protein FOPG_14178 [Fusarium oxysporum f. sp. conglutinans race 2 54008]|uniref:Uncharacterized protein n=1 Tax=Fusarium oxysporum f. sp. conglutinans race 2 54008 TaxID=1089457 RepID=X0I9J1_FUSOX|nr:hypothetical protein FOPG_14178 [Fusarium oxysporum f. sp. conglutinans race 2 54008]